MKIAVILIALLVTFANAEEEEEEIEWTPIDEALAQGYEECMESMKPSNETLDLVDRWEGFDNKDVQCYLACEMEKAGIRNGLSVDLEKMESLLRTAENPDEENIQRYMEIFKACKAEAEVSDDECEVMGKFMECWTNKTQVEQADP